MQWFGTHAFFYYIFTFITRVPVEHLKYHAIMAGNKTDSSFLDRTNECRASPVYNQLLVGLCHDSLMKVIRKISDELALEATSRN